MRMRRTPGSTLASAVLLVVLAAACSAGDVGGGGDRPATATTATTAAAGSTVDTGEGGWTQFGHDLANSRLSPDESGLTVDTVGDLAESWSLDGIVGVTSTPTVVDGVAYFGDWTGQVHAVDTATGDEIWTTPLGGSVIGSVPVDGDALFASSGITVYRLDRATGDVQWETSADDHPFAMISASPVVADGVVVQGVASGEVTFPQDDYTFTGSVSGYDVETGEQIWRLDTTPGDATAGAGVGVWSTAAVDVGRGLAFVGTGNTYEEPSAPLADSLLALDLRSGEIVWSRAFTSPDVFSAGAPGGPDADVGAAPMLWTSDGRDLVGVGDKAGVFHTLDRESGDIVWETTLTPGSSFGGVNGSSAFVDGTLVVSSNIGDPETNAPLNTAQVFGLDAATGEIAWTTDLEGMVFAPISTAPGLAFVGTTLGTFLVLDAATGEELWTQEAPNQIGAGPAVVDGDVLWGYGYALFDGPGEGGLINFTVPPP
ncbi:MAG TPA: PQQ-binding-like beta-propeller repeat protein [Acidimicrobiales bacterium]